MKLQKGIMTALLVVVFFFSVFPFLVLLYKCFHTGADGWTLKYLKEIVESRSTWVAIRNTLGVSLGTTLLSICFALPVAWVLGRTQVSHTKTLRSLFCLPYAIPPYVGAIAWISLANPSTGFLNLVFGTGTFDIYSTFGLIWVMATFFYTFILLAVLSSLDRMDPSLEEAARISGAGPWKVFWQVSFPILLPSLLGGALLVFLASAASFGVPALIGNPARIYLMTTKIYTQIKMGSMSGLYRAGTLSFLLIIIALGLLYFYQWSAKRNRFKTMTGKTSRPSLIDLGRARPFVQGFLYLMLGILFFLPMGGIFLSSLSVAPGKVAFDNLGLKHFYVILFETDETGRSIANSLLLGGGAATVAVGLGLLMSYFQTKTKAKGRKFLDTFASLPYSVPGTVLALALILSFSRTFEIGDYEITLYGTLALIGIAYVVKFLSFAIRTTGDGFSQIDDVLAEAARVSGATWWTSMKTIWFPLLKPAIVASWFLIFMPAFSELTMTILLYGPGTETMGTLLFQLQEYANPSGAAVLALMVVMIVVLCNVVVKSTSRGKYGL